MLRHNLLLIYRNFLRFKSTFLINLTGLSTGLACTLLIYLWVTDELKIDQFHEKGGQLYQVMENRIQADRIWTAESTSGLLAESMLKDFPEVEYAVVTTWADVVTLTRDEKDVRAAGRYVGSDYFNAFSFELVQGDKNKVLRDKKSVVLSDELAMKLFNTTEGVIGKTVIHQHDREYIVSGIFRKTPSHSSEKFDFLLSFEEFRSFEWVGINWRNTSPRTYIVLKEGTDIDQFNGKIADYIVKKTNGEITYRTMFIRPYSDAYLYNEYENGVQAGGRITYVKLFSIIAIFIVVIACINFMNLSTAKASRRIKEVGIKKAIGAGRRALVMQYMGESMLIAFLSLTIAIILVTVSLPQFNEITGKQLLLYFDANLIMSVIGLTFITGLIAGSYPALFLSGFRPATVLRGKINGFTGEGWARKGLVVFQFVLSVILIVSVIVVYRQVEYVQSKNLGYDKDNVIYFRREGSLWQHQNLESFLLQVKNIPGITHASSISHDMTGHNSGTWGLQWEGKNPDDRTEFENVPVNYGMLELLGIEMVEGRTFSKEFPSDSMAIIINEAGIKFMGMKDPIGKKVILWDQYEMHIVGVARDFHFESLHQKVKPLFFRLNQNNTRHIMVKIEAGAKGDVVGKLQEFYQSFNPGFPFEYKFIDQEYQAQYEAENRIAVLSRYFAGLAILISCLGLFGLAAFTAERRLKEIGIRKILGSSDLGIMYLLSGDFTRMVITAIFIGLPLSYLITDKWLENFEYRIPLQIWYFAGAGLIALFIAWFTVGLQTVRAARINPSECLRDE